MSENSELYGEYFKLRSIDEQTYNNYMIPYYMDNILPKDKNTSILDIGCGYGQMLASLKRKGYTNLHGIDVAPDAVDFCQRQNLDVVAVDDIVYFNNTEKYDLIIMSHVLEHIEKSKVIEILKHIRTKLLKSGGAFLLMVPNAQSNTGAYWMYEDFTHYTLYTAGSVLYVLKAAGFADIKFLDSDGVESAGTWYGKLIRKFFLKIYDFNKYFWNKITLSAYYRESPRIYTFELKVYAK
jgi:SAM-dependent methyltransferase